MIQTSADFAEAVKTSNRMAARVMVVIDGDIVEDTFYNGSTLRLISTESNFTYDRESEQRTNASLTMLGSGQTAREMVDPLTNAEFYTFLGVDIGTDNWEWVPLGPVSAMDLVTVKVGGSVMKFQATCLDRSERINSNGWQDPFQVASGLSYFTAVQNIITNRAQGFTPEFNMPTATGGLTTPSLFFSDTDPPWNAAVKAAQGEGTELFFDRYGVVKALRLTDPLAEQPAWVLGGSEYDVVIRETSKSVSKREVYTGVICRSEAPWLLFPVSATVWDTDPLSRTYSLGPLGQRPKRINDSLATTQAQCLSIAQAEFNKIKGITEDVSFGSLRDPRLEVGDTIEFYDDDLGATGFYTLQRLTLELGSGKMAGMLRRRK